MKTTIIFSDLHLCDNSNANDFHHKDTFLAFLDHFKDPEKYLLIGAGDIFDDIQADATKIAYYNEEIIKAMRSLKNLVLLPGNHDWIFGKYLNRYWESETIHVEHGNIFDIYNATPSRIGRPIAKIISWLERLISKDTDKWLLAMAENIKHITPASKNYPGDYSEYKEAANKIFKVHDKKICVFGHTHKAGIWLLENGVYANAGCWTGYKTPTYIEIYKDEVTLHKTTDENF